MKLSIQVAPNAKTNQITQLSATKFQIKTTAPALNNLANETIIKLLAKHLKVKKSQLVLLSGEKSRQKTVLLLD